MDKKDNMYNFVSAFTKYVEETDKLSDKNIGFVKDIITIEKINEPIKNETTDKL